MTSTSRSGLENTHTRAQPLQQPDPQEATPNQSDPTSIRPISKNSSTPSACQHPSASPDPQQASANPVAIVPKSPASSSLRPPRSTWLDALPPELCKYIAKCVSCCDEPTAGLPHGQTDNLLHLAEVSDKQRHAVVDALSNRFVSSLENIERWAAVFRDGTTHFVSVEWYDESGEHNGKSRDDLALQKLRPDMLTELSISNRVKNCQILCRARQLRTLRVRFTRNSLDVLSISLKKLDKLVKLSLHCSKKHLCLFKKLLPTKEAWADLATFCPYVSELEVICTCPIFSNRHHIGPLVGVLPKLRRLTFNLRAPDEALPYLQGLESVELEKKWSTEGKSLERLTELASKIGGPVTSIQNDKYWDFEFLEGINGSGLARLARCPRITKLDMVLKKGAERAFPKLRHLQSLRLAWEPSLHVSLLDRPTMRAAYAPPSSFSFHATYAPPSSFLFHLIEEAPDLRELRLNNVRFSLGVLNMVLETIGIRLEVFSTSLCDQSESAAERAVAVMESARRFNPALKKLVFTVGLDVLDFNLLIDTHPRRLGFMRESVLRALHMLHRRAPLLNYKELLELFKMWMR